MQKYPNLKEPFLTRHKLYNETVRFCEELEKQGKAIILRPLPEEALDSFESDVIKIERAYYHGYNMAIERLDEIKKLITSQKN